MCSATSWTASKTSSCLATNFTGFLHYLNLIIGKLFVSYPPFLVHHQQVLSKVKDTFAFVPRAQNMQLCLGSAQCSLSWPTAKKWAWLLNTRLTSLLQEKVLFLFIDPSSTVSRHSKPVSCLYLLHGTVPTASQHWACQAVRTLRPSVSPYPCKTANERASSLCISLHILTLLVY